MTRIEPVTMNRDCGFMTMGERLVHVCGCHWMEPTTTNALYYDKNLARKREARRVGGESRDGKA